MKTKDLKDLHRKISIERWHNRLREKLARTERNRAKSKPMKKKTELSSLVSFWLKANDAKTKRRNEQSEIFIQAPKVFSFIENPVGMVDFLNELMIRGSSNQVSRIWVDQRQSNKLDLCADAVTSVIIDQLRKSYHKNFNGNLPDDEECKKTALISGMVKNLGLSKFHSNEYLNFPLIEGRKLPEKATESSLREITETKFTDYIDECLIQCGFELTEDGHQKVSSLVGETIDNAENHSGRYHWWIQGYQQAIEDNLGECHLVLFNFGRSIFESMQDLPDDSPLRARIDELVLTHQNRGLFSHKWDRKALWTLYALQEGASRLNTGPESPNDRGQGTADLIQFFQEIGQSSTREKQPHMCIYSGDVFVKFDNKYRLAHRRTADNTRRQIAFNANNDLNLPPDEQYVRKLPGTFPGVLVSMRFFVDSHYLKDIKDRAKN